MHTLRRASIPLLAGLALAASDGRPRIQDGAEAFDTGGAEPYVISVSGSAVHFPATDIVHSQDSTETGMVRQSTTITEIRGDLKGYDLILGTRTFDVSSGPVVEGTHVFSGTIAGSDPVLGGLSEVRFEGSFQIGEPMGEIHFSDVRLSWSNDAPHEDGWYDCHLVAVPTGTTSDGGNTSSYNGECTRRRS